MIYEALSTLKDTNGSDVIAIASFIEVRWSSLMLLMFSYIWQYTYYTILWVGLKYPVFWDYAIKILHINY